MDAVRKIVGLAAAIAVVFGVALGTGTLWGPAQSAAAGHDGT